MESKIEESLRKEIRKNPNEETTIQIRLFDDRTGMAFYKHLTKEELCRILGTWDKMQWQ